MVIYICGRMEMAVVRANTMILRGSRLSRLFIPVRRYGGICSTGSRRIRMVGRVRGQRHSSNITGTIIE